MIKYLITALLFISSVAHADEVVQYSDIVHHRDSGDYSGFSVNLKSNTLLLCEGSCSVYKLRDVLRDFSGFSFNVTYVKYNTTVFYKLNIVNNKVILRVLREGNRVVTYDRELYACTITKPARVNCWSHEKFKMRDNLVL